MDIAGAIFALLAGSLMYVAAGFMHHSAIGYDIAVKKHFRSFRRHMPKGLGLRTRLFFLDFRDAVNPLYFAAYIAHLVIGLVLLALLVLYAATGLLPQPLRDALLIVFALDGLLFWIPYSALFRNKRKK